MELELDKQLQQILFTILEKRYRNMIPEMFLIECIMPKITHPISSHLATWKKKENITKKTLYFT